MGQVTDNNVKEKPFEITTKLFLQALSHELEKNSDDTFDENICSRGLIKSGEKKLGLSAIHDVTDKEINEKIKKNKETGNSSITVKNDDAVYTIGVSFNMMTQYFGEEAKQRQIRKQIVMEAIAYETVLQVGNLLVTAEETEEEIEQKVADVYNYRPTDILRSLLLSLNLESSNTAKRQVEAAIKLNEAGLLELFWDHVKDNEKMLGYIAGKSGSVFLKSLKSHIKKISDDKIKSKFVQSISELVNKLPQAIVDSGVLNGEFFQRCFADENKQNNNEKDEEVASDSTSSNGGFAEGIEKLIGDYQSESGFAPQFYPAFYQLCRNNGIPVDKEIIECSIDDYPTFRVLSDGKHVIKGDLHANAMNLLHFLITEGIADFNGTDKEKKNTYAELNKFYIAAGYANMQDDWRNLAYFEDRFLKLISDKLVIKNKNKFIHFIGDTLSDRGASDYLMVKLFERLNNEGVNFSLHHANHDHDFDVAINKEVLISQMQLLRALLPFH